MNLRYICSKCGCDLQTGDTVPDAGGIAVYIKPCNVCKKHEEKGAKAKKPRTK